MRVLVACEYSGVVRRAFRERGHEAWSCDLLPAEDGSPYHLLGNVLPWLKAEWDLMIAHPPCTYLSRAGARWWKDPERQVKADEAAERPIAAVVVGRRGDNAVDIARRVGRRD